MDATNVNVLTLSLCAQHLYVPLDQVCLLVGLVVSEVTLSHFT